MWEGLAKEARQLDPKEGVNAILGRRAPCVHGWRWSSEKKPVDFSCIHEKWLDLGHSLLGVWHRNPQSWWCPSPVGNHLYHHPGAELKMKMGFWIRE